MKGFPSLILLIFLVVVVCPPARLNAGASPSYQPSVRPGQWAEYKPLNYSCTGSVSYCSTLRNPPGNVSFAAVQVFNVSGTSAVLRITTAYTNGSVLGRGASVDVSTGADNVTGVFMPPMTPANYLVLTGGLAAPEPMWVNDVGDRLTGSRSESVLGSSRNVNFLNHTSTTLDSSFSFGFAFDQESGFLLETSSSFTRSLPSGSIQNGFAMRMIDNNIWLYSALPDFVNTGSDFTISSGERMSFQTGASGSSSITVMGKNVFAYTIALHVSSPAGLSCSLGKTNIEGQGSTSLTCTGQPGSYTVTVTATSGQNSHSTQVAVQVSSLPTSTQTQTSKTTNIPLPTILSLVIILAALGIVGVAAVLLAFLLLRRRSNKPAIVPSMPPPSSPTP